MNRHLQQLEARIARLEQSPVRLKPGNNIRLQQIGRDYIIHGTPAGTSYRPPSLPWFFSTTSILSDPDNEESPMIPALKVSENSLLWDYAGGLGVLDRSPRQPLPLDPLEFTAGTYFISLRIRYSDQNPLLPEINNNWLDEDNLPTHARIEVDTEVPPPLIEGTDPNATIREHSIHLGTLEIDSEGILTVSNFRHGQPITLWPAAIEGLPTSHPLY